MRSKGGGALYSDGDDIIRKCHFITNQAPQGGAIGTTDGIIIIENNNFIGNKAISAGYGGALFFGDSSIVTFNNNIVAYNDAFDGHSGGIWFCPIVEVSFTCNDFWDNAGGDICGNGHDTSEVDLNTVFENPIFCDYENGNYYISSYSPCAPSNSKCGTLIGMYDVDCETCCNLAGDVNDNDEINILDITYAINYLYKGGPEPPCLDEADADGNCKMNILDIAYLILYLYRGGPSPVCGCIP